MLLALNTSASESIPVSVITSGTASICPGASASISAIASDGDGGPYLYLWMPGSISGATITVSPTLTTTYTVTASDGSGSSASATVTITVLQVPLVSFSSNDTAGCAPLCVSFTDMSTISSGAITAWNWNFGDGSISTIQNPMNCYNISASYGVSLTASSSSGCTSTMTNNNYIDVYPSPVANFSSSPSPPNTINFTDLSSGATSWNWDFGDGNFSSLQNPMHTYAGPGSYSVTLTVQNSFGCIVTYTIVIVITGINEYYLNDLVNISPNPLNTSAIIELKNTKLNLQNAHFILLDVLGKEITRIKLDDYKTSIEKGNLNSGIYFYKVMNKNQIISTGKLAVE